MGWLVLAEAWFKVNKRSNETVDLGKRAPEIEQRNSTGQHQCTAEMILGEECLVCISQHNNVAHGFGKSLHAKQDGINPQAQRYQTRKKHQNTKGSILTKYEWWTQGSSHHPDSVQMDSPKANTWGGRQSRINSRAHWIEVRYLMSWGKRENCAGKASLVNCQTKQ